MKEIALPGRHAGNADPNNPYSCKAAVGITLESPMLRLQESIGLSASLLFPSKNPVRFLLVWHETPTCFITNTWRLVQEGPQKVVLDIRGRGLPLPNASLADISPACFIRSPFATASFDPSPNQSIRQTSQCSAPPSVNPWWTDRTTSSFQSQNKPSWSSEEKAKSLRTRLGREGKS